MHPRTLGIALLILAVFGLFHFSKTSAAGLVNVAGSPMTATSSSGIATTSTVSSTLSSTAAPTATPKASTVLNISTRLAVGTSDNALIGGFIVTGVLPKKVVVRAIGPSLSLPGKLANPTLELHKPDGTVIKNDNWRDTQQAAIIATGVAPKNNLESAIVATLLPGKYTAIVRGKNGGTGVAVVECYDLSRDSVSSLANISTRGSVKTGDNVMIGGFILGGTHSSQVLIRALGPSLTALHVAGALQDPTLALYDKNGVVIRTNDNWPDTQMAAIRATTIPPSNPREAAILATLSPAPYTAIVRGKNGATGVALVEAYNLTNSTPKPFAYSLDLTDQPGGIGNLMIDAASRYVAAELVDKNGGSVKRNAGLALADNVANSSVVLTFSSSGIPSRLALGRNVEIDFLGANAQTRRVTWQARNSSGHIVIAARTDSASVDFFALAGSSLSFNEIGNAATNNSVVPSLSTQLVAVGKATLGFVALAALPLETPIASSIIGTATIFITAMNFWYEATGKEKPALYHTLSFGFGAVEGALAFGAFDAVVGAAADGLATADFLAESAHFLSASISGVDAANDLHDTANTVEQMPNPAQQVDAYIAAAQAARSQAGLPTDLVQDGTSPLIYFLVTRDQNYFNSMGAARANLNNAQGIVDAIADATVQGAAQVKVDSAKQSFSSTIATDEAGVMQLQSVDQQAIGEAQATLPDGQQHCQQGIQSGCDLVTYDELILQDGPANLLVEQAILDSLATLEVF